MTTAPRPELAPLRKRASSTIADPVDPVPWTPTNRVSKPPSHYCARSLAGVSEVSGRGHTAGGQLDTTTRSALPHGDAQRSRPLQASLFVFRLTTLDSGFWMSKQARSSRSGCHPLGMILLFILQEPERCFACEEHICMRPPGWHLHRAGGEND
ncbi:MAG: hypothetical protein L6R36_004671 [Xanthoria steineri]|nr:MAG: hypothetical protein L6R36_004671 [Xanthoria steineri]